MILELPKHLEEWVMLQVQTGKYASAKELIQNTLENAKQQQTQAELETMLERGFDDLEQGRTYRFDSLQAFQSAIKARAKTA